ncbi:hypothetical protein LJR129_004953 [Acidovorax sp. LjRoot129]|uniref:hypothetical protein n=1 Tax=unclassified Acidovorax TaxID=2684926 RepID=UPI003ECE2821
MKITVEVTRAELTQMDADADELESALQLGLMSGVAIQGDILYINELSLNVVVVDGAGSGSVNPFEKILAQARG